MKRFIVTFGLKEKKTCLIFSEVFSSQSARIHIHSPFLSHWKRTGKVLYFQIYLLSRCLYRFSEAFPINKQRPGAPVEVERRPWNLNGRLTKTASHDVGGGHRNNGEEKRRRNRRREGRRRGKRRRKAVNLSSGWKRSLGNSDSQPAAIRSDLDFQQRTLQLWHGSTRESSITMCQFKVSGKVFGNVDFVKHL